MFSEILLALRKAGRATLFLLLAASSAHASPASDPESTATLPLARILEMQKQIDDASKEVEAPPPLDATLHRIELSGRLLGDAVEFDAHFEIDVLADDIWVEIPLLHLDAGTHLLTLPKVAGGSFAVIDGKLHFITSKRKRYQFDLSILEEASAEGERRSLRLQLAQASVSTCKLTFDEGLFELLNTRVLSQPDGVLVFPSEAGFSIDWSVREAETAREVVKKPEIASVVSVAHASSVSTLEGMRITRVLYRLRFAGHKSIDFEIPEGQVVERAYLNGFAVPAETRDRRFRIEAVPARAGDEAATVELVMTADEGVYHLAGDMALALPRVSWPMNEIFLSLHLPDVFNYEWKGGSLSPVPTSPAPDYTYRVPLPGKKMSFHQYLVTAQAPHVSLEYAVDLEDQYFCAKEPGLAYRTGP